MWVLILPLGSCCKSVMTIKWFSCPFAISSLHWSGFLQLTNKKTFKLKILAQKFWAKSDKTEGRKKYWTEFIHFRFKSSIWDIFHPFPTFLDKTNHHMSISLPSHFKAYSHRRHWKRTNPQYECVYEKLLVEYFKWKRQKFKSFVSPEGQKDFQFRFNKFSFRQFESR